MRVYINILCWFVFFWIDTICMLYISYILKAGVYIDMVVALR